MSLNFDEIVSVAGKGGLFKVLKPTKNGYVVEEMDNQRKKLVLGPNHRVSLLKEISIYTTDAEGAIPLSDVYALIKEKYNKEIPVNPKDDKDELFDFLADIVPEFDSEKVYHSDVKKLVSWYKIILKEEPDISFKEEEEKKKKDSKKPAQKKTASKKSEDSGKSDKKGESKKTDSKSKSSK